MAPLWARGNLIVASRLHLYAEEVLSMQRMAAAALVVFLGVTGVACDDDPTGPSGDNTVRFTSTLLPANEVPPITGPEASGNGTATITLNLTRDSAGNIVAATADFSVTLNGFPANTPVTAAHIHPGAAGATGSPLVNMGLGVNEVVLANGSGTFSKTGVSVTAGDAQSIINSPASFYFNVHSTLNPGGFARGQLVRQ
jgi:hypothetical protein